MRRESVFTGREKERLREILTACRVLAVVGMSRDPAKTANRVPHFLIHRGFDIVPVNPKAKVIDGLKTYPSLMAVEKKIDAVVIFRPVRDVMKVVEEAVRRRDARGDIRVIWMQEGIRDGAAARLAENRGITVVQDRCMAKAYISLVERGAE